MKGYVTFHEQQECVYGFPSLPLSTRASADISEWFLNKSGEAKCTSVTVIPYLDSKCKKEFAHGEKNHIKAKKSCQLALFSSYSHLSNKHEVTLTDFEKFHPPQKKIHPPRLLIFQVFSTLHFTFIAFMYYVFPKNPTLHVYSSLQVYQIDESIGMNYSSN